MFWGGQLVGFHPPTDSLEVGHGIEKADPQFRREKFSQCVERVWDGIGGQYGDFHALWIDDPVRVDPSPVAWPRLLDTRRIGWPRL
jgi:hypothetical protein